MFTRRWKVAHQELSPLDIAHGQLVSQVYEVLTGQPLKVSLKLGKPVEFDYRGRPSLVGSVPFVRSGHYVDHLPNGTLVTPGSLYRYELHYNLALFKPNDDDSEAWVPDTGYIHVIRPDISWTAVHKAPFSAKWYDDGRLRLGPLEVWVRCGFRGRNFRDREEFRNHLRGSVYTS